MKPENKDSKPAMEKFEIALTATQLPPKMRVHPIKGVM